MFTVVPLDILVVAREGEERKGGRRKEKRSSREELRAEGADIFTGLAQTLDTRNTREARTKHEDVRGTVCPAYLSVVPPFQVDGQ